MTNDIIDIIIINNVLLAVKYLQWYYYSIYCRWCVASDIVCVCVCITIMKVMCVC